MPTIIKQIKYLPLLLIIVVLLLSACITTAQTTTPPQVTIHPSSASPTSVNPVVLIVNKVEMVYFHLAQRCVTCLCFEEQLNYVTKTYFSDAITSGKLVYKVLEIGKKENAPIVSKYNAYGSQLFINISINNKDDIREIQEIWNWKCPTDKKGFDEKLINLIELSLNKIK